MTDEELATIRERLAAIDEERATHRYPTVDSYMSKDVRTLLAEVERLRSVAGMLDLVTHALEQERASNAAMREIVEAVANAGADPNYGSQATLLLLCPGDDAETIRDQARALLAAEDAQDKQEQEQ